MGVNSPGSLTVAARLVVFVYLIAVSALAGCGNSSGDGGTDPLPCAISNVNTGVQHSWFVGVGGPVSLRWDRQGAATDVKIELLKAGSVVAVVAASTPNDGFYAWTPTVAGQGNGNDFGLRVTALGETACAGELTGLTLTDVSGCSITYTTPAFNSIRAGDPLAVQWTSASTSGLLDIELWQDDLGSEPELVGVVVENTPDDGEFIWDPVDSFHFGTDSFFQLRILDPRVAGCTVSSPLFMLIDEVVCSCTVTGFAAGTAFDLNQTMTLMLEQENGGGLVNLRLYVGAQFVPGGIIADDVPINQNYNWTVFDFAYTGAERSRFRIKAIDAADGYCTGVSDVFTIR